jgi:hypothetical protein
VVLVAAASVDPSLTMVIEFAKVGVAVPASAAPATTAVVNAMLDMNLLTRIIASFDECLKRHNKNQTT